MRSAFRTALLATIAAQPVAAADPLCCRLFGFDASNWLGTEAVACGNISDADERSRAEALAWEERRRATQCALEAQAKRRAFVYTYRMLVSPDVDMINQAVFGANGERMWLRKGQSGGQNLYSIEVCNELTVLADGKLKGSGCYETYPGKLLD